jgi:4-hydroxybenzoate polyprenyltransferase
MTDWAMQAATKRPDRLILIAQSLRVRQWSKNLLLFAGLLFAAKLGDGGRWLEAWLAFAVYSLGSSGAYLFNDVRDAERDRLHPVKRTRPVASGALRPRDALTLAAALATMALLAAAELGSYSVLFVSAFLALQVAYSLQLKYLAFVDVLTIAALFVLRAAAGAEAVHVHISPWLLACTALLALFLGLAKRRGELLLVEAAATPGRPVLARYSISMLDRLLVAAAASTVTAYAFYAFTARDSIEMAATIPLVLFPILRYLALVHREGLGEEPEQVLLTDAPILVSAAAWSVASSLILMLS